MRAIAAIRGILARSSSRISATRARDLLDCVATMSRRMSADRRSRSQIRSARRSARSPIVDPRGCAADRRRDLADAQRECTAERRT
ncbi:unnamed protein product [Trichogramma brassicae]|uniref:Uncharacterized protein n=1 Tax=Trichogramma brassicae TaxID=86971 RepID=A0A6H5HUU3_9HYME|nr:unnamed protein product [Trichogramma brassicae]